MYTKFYLDAQTKHNCEIAVFYCKRFKQPHSCCESVNVRSEIIHKMETTFFSERKLPTYALSELMSHTNTNPTVVQTHLISLHINVQFIYKYIVLPFVCLVDWLIERGFNTDTVIIRRATH